MPRKSATTPLDVNGPDPLYKQVCDRILQCLAEGEWQPGEQLPTESQLATRFGVAVFTLRAGISDLVSANILIRKQGKGTFVARHSRLRQRYQFSHIYDENGRQILPERQLLSFGRSAAHDMEADALTLPRGNKSQVFRLKMLSKENSRTVATLDIVLPVLMFSGLTAAAVRNAQENLYAAYQDACSVNVIRIEERIRAGAATASEARALELRIATPVLRVERIAYTYRNVPVEFRTRVFNSSKFHYRTSEGSL